MKYVGILVCSVRMRWNINIQTYVSKLFLKK